MSRASISRRLSVIFLSMMAGCGFGGGPGSPHYFANLTVFNRTIADVRVWSGEGGQQSFTVPACGEVTQPGFPVNWWWLGSEGRNTFHSGGGVDTPQSFVIVTDTPVQTEDRPASLPPPAGKASMGISWLRILRM